MLERVEESFCRLLHYCIVPLFILKVGVEESIVNLLFGLRITDQLFKSDVFTRVVRSQSTLQRQL
jgi:hypothetical protein